MTVRRWAGALIVVAASTLVFSNTLGFEFVWDDAQIVVRDRSIESLNSLPAALAKPLGYFGEEASRGSLWRPVLTLSLFADTQLWGKDRPWGYHLTNVLIHTAAAALFYLLLLRAVGSAPIALFGALFFALHPVQSEAVSNVSARGTPLSGLFVLIAFLVWPRRRWLSSAAYLAAMYSKETAVPFLGFLLAHDLWTGQGRDLRRTIVRLWPAAAAAAVYFVSRFLVLGGLGSAATDVAASPYTSWSSRLWIQPVYLAEYVKMVLVPMGLHHWRELYFPREFFEPAYFGPFLLLVGVMVAGWRSVKKGSFEGMGLVWAAVFYTVIQNLFFISNSPVKEHWLYLPLMGVVWWVAATVCAVSGRARERGGERPFVRIGTAAGVVVLFVLGAVTVRQNLVWKNDLVLFEHTSRFVKHDPMILNNLGVAYAERGRFDDAEAAFHRALTIDPKDANALFNLQKLEKDRGRRGQAPTAGPASEARLETLAMGSDAAYEDPAERADAFEELGYCLEDMELDLDRLPGVTQEAEAGDRVFKYNGRRIDLLEDPVLRDLAGRCGEAADRLRNEDEEVRRSLVR